MTNAPPKPSTSPSSHLEFATCLGCGYPLRGLEGGRCPECGRRFDPDNPDTMNAPNSAERRLRRALHWAPLPVWLTVFTVVFFGAAYLVAVFDVWERIPFAPAVLFISAIAIAGFARRRARRALIGPGPDPAAKHERAWRVVMALMCVYIFFAMSGNGVKSWSCPHGTGVSLGPFGIAHSTVGGPCRNSVLYDKAWNVFGPWYVWVAFSG